MEKVSASRVHGDLPKQRPGEHLWTIVGMWRAADPAALDGGGAVILDHENLIDIEGPGCLWCCEIYSAETAAEPCRGEAV